MSSDFDDLDRALSSGLSALAPDAVDGVDALASLRPGFQRARTRRRVVKAGASLAALLVIGSVGVLASPRSTRSHVTVSSPPTTTADTRAPVKRTTTSKPTGTAPKVTTTTTAPAVVTSPPTGGTHHSGNTSPTTPVTNPPPVPITAPNGGGPGTSAGGGHGHGHDDGSTTTSTTVPPGKVETYFSPGGNIVVRETNTSVVLLKVDRHPGYYKEINASGPRHVDVRFLQNGHEKYRIVLDVKDGHVVQTAHDEGDGPGSDAHAGPGPGDSPDPSSGESPGPGPGTSPATESHYR